MKKSAVVIMLIFIISISLNLLITTDKVFGAVGGDQTSVAERISSRTFPSVFQAWGGILNMPQVSDKNELFAMHDLCWWGVGDEDSLVWDTSNVIPPNPLPDYNYRYLATDFTPESIQSALAWSQALRAKNPNIVLLANINYRGGKYTWLPPESNWWMRNSSGNRILTQGSEANKNAWYRLDFVNREDFRERMAKYCADVVNAGIYDGVMIDWWDENNAAELPGRMDLLKKIRAGIPNGLIIVNSNDRKPVNAAPYINGVFMETGTRSARATTPERWAQIQDTLMWNQANIPDPKLRCLEVWYSSKYADNQVPPPGTGFDEYNRMRAATTMSLTLSNGYVLFSEDNDAAGLDHKHWWYDFWNANLGKSVGGLNSLHANGTYMREFENGYAVYNPMGNGSKTVLFPVNYKSVATGQTQKNHAVADQDGDIFLLAETIAVGVSITGKVQVGETLTGNYIFKGINGDLEGTSIFKWYRSDGPNGNNKEVISVADANTYVLQKADIGKFISFEVTPVAQTGINPGTAVESALTGPARPEGWQQNQEEKKP